ncbi:MLP-like protein 423 [Tanacetum coccineum]|uniref:MLP-like protein 423 n=1 Tax=Tanacetum coccineum TaxID=301880 RepID=A0ABQ5CWU1_9ASTR
MTTIGKLDVEVKVKSGADKFWQSIMDSADIFPKVCSDLYKNVEILEGDGHSVGSVRMVNFAEGNVFLYGKRGLPIVKSAKEKIEELDEAKKKVAYSVIDGDMMQYYKSFKATLEVIPEGEGSLVKWLCEFEKASEQVPDPEMIRDFAAKNFKEIDEYLLKA